MQSRKHSYLLTLGHIATDINQGALPAMLPFLILAYDLSYAAAAALVFASSMISSVVQPLFGHLGDRYQRPWLMAVGIMMAGSGIAVMGLVSEYWALFLCAATTGIGVALFHPEGGRLANVVAGQNKGEGISNFAVGGNLGFAIGPLIVAGALGFWGMQGTVVFLLPALVVSVIIVSQNNVFNRFSEVEALRIKEDQSASTVDDWGTFWRVTTVNIFRSILGNGMIVFLPLYWSGVLLQPIEYGSLVLTVYTGAGAITTFLGGRLADKVGFKRVILLCSLALVPLLGLFLITKIAVLAVLFAVLAGAVLSLSYSPVVTLAQQSLPNHLGLASGISLGVVVSVGGMCTPAIGAVGDAYGLQTALFVLCGVSLLIALSALVLFFWKKKKSGSDDELMSKNDLTDSAS